METDAQTKVLKYLQENKAANTFKLARNLGIDRSKIVRELAKLAEKGLIEHRTGMARFLSTPKLSLREPVQKISQPKTQKTESEKTGIRKETPSASAKLAGENKKLRAKIAHLKSGLEQQTGLDAAVKLKAAQTHIEKLESQVQHLTRKAAAVKTKVIREVIIRPKIIRKVIVRHIQAKNEQIKERSPRKGLGVDARKPAISPSWLSKIHRNISQLSVPKVLEQKIELKGISPDLSKLKDNICQLEIPELLRKGI